ncbi:MAG: YSIRK-type signal peptide-containing protein, partial [Gemella haemolysans]|uniref:YSIRK-type signal peptide-containing protein n=1 Tax=Gemella haemolysans TaxID=1379 RepID=UPI0026EA4103
MIGKNNKKLKELKQGVKVESYSIKKFKFGAASIVIGASIFFGTGVASANEVAASSDSSATNDTNATSGNGDKVPEKINTVSAEKESVASVNKPSSVKEESTKVEVEKKVVDKSLLETSITKLEELLATVNKDKAPASTLSAVNVDLINAKSILENANASQEEVDALVKKLKQQTQIVSSMPKVTTKEKEVKEGANTIANSGSRDSRNGKSMGEGTQFRAYTATSSSGAMKNVRYFASTDPKKNGGQKLRNDDPEFTERKTVVKSRYEQNSSGRWMVYDVYFNNNGIPMVDLSYGQHYYFQPPFNIMDPSNTVRDLTITRYRNVDGNPNRKLSDGGSGFQQVGSTVTISDPWHQKDRLFDGDRRSLYDPNSGVTRANQKWYVFKNNQNDGYLDSIVRKTDGNYTGGVSYTLGMEVGKVDTSYAIHMTARVKLRDNVTDQQAANGNVYAASVTSGRDTNHSYIVGSRGTSVKAEPDAPKDPIKGKTVTKTVGEALGDPDDPANSGYVRHKYGKPFPPGMTWSWVGDVKPTSTAQAGVFKYTSVATYQDGTKSTDANSGSDGRVTVIVKPKPPIITPNLEHKKGLPNQQITVNVGNGVPNNSKVNIYDGDRIIGTGTTNGQTAIVTVKEPLPGKPLKAETVVTNSNGTVTSDRSNPVTPTEAPDTQAPTLKVTEDKTVVEGETVTFTVTAKDDKHVNLILDDFTKKYGSRLVNSQVTTNYEKNTDTEKILTINIKTTAEDVGKPNKITFKAIDNASPTPHKANDVTFTFNVTPRDNQKPIVEVGGVRLTETEPKSAQFYVYRGATFNPTVKAWDDSGKITSMSVENLPKGSQAPTYTAQTGKDGSSDAKKYITNLSTGTVADTQTLGDHVAKFKISDGKNNATYLMKYKVVDVVVENTPKTVDLNSKSGDPNSYLNTAGEQDKSGKPVVGPQADVHFPGGMNFRWDNAKGSDTNITLSKVGEQTHKAIAVFPKSPSNRNGIPVFAPETAERNVIFNVVDNEKPKATLNGVTLSETANEPIFTVYRGATFNPELKVSDNSGVISKVEVKGGLPNGVTPSTFTAQTGKTEATPYAERLSSGTVLNTETLGVHESTLHVEGSSPSDSRDFKFKYRVVDIETKNLDEHGIAKVPVASTLNKANSSKNIDAHNYLKVVDSQDKADRGNNYLPSGMTWTWKDRNGNNPDPGTTLDNSGKYTRTATAIFPGTNANNITDANSTTRTTFAPAEIKRQVILAVTPTAPIVEGKENGSVTITPPTRPNSTNKQDIDKITITYIPTGKTTPETVTVTKSGNNWTVNGKTPDKVSVTPEGVVTISDAEVADKTEVTAKVSKNVDNTPLESPVARGTANGPLAAEVTNPAPVPEKAPVTPVTVVTPNKPGSSITVDGPVNGLTVDEEGKLKGKPEVNDWKPKEEERTVEIPVKVTKGGETVTVKVPVPILRDTDGDGIPDKEDSDDDNDGIPDEEEIKNGTDPKVANGLTGTVTGKTVPE